MKEKDIMTSFMRIIATVEMLLIVGAPTLVHADRAPVAIENHHG